MQLIAHRRNTIEELKTTNSQFGVEVDVRLHNSQLVCQHDPLKPGDLFDEWLENFQHKTLIVNVKEEGLEELVLDALARHHVEDFFFLDQTFPFLLKHAKKGLNQAAVRVSEFESLETALNLRGLVTWVWVDLFNDFPLSKENIDALKSAGFKLCLVSPELHGRTDEKLVSDLKKLFKDLGFSPDAVCTKRPELWGA